MSRLHQLLASARRFFEKHLKPEHVRYFEENYWLRAETVARACLGYAPVEGGLLEWFLDHGFNSKEARSTGLLWMDGRPCWRGRLVFPYMVGGRPEYFIARRTDESADLPGKYLKQLRSTTKKPRLWLDPGIREPIFGVDSVRDGEPLVITEGITDVLAAQQAGYACVAPITVRFKGEVVSEAAAICRQASSITIIMDNEDSRGGEDGAVATGLMLSRMGLAPRIGTLPRPENAVKVDLCDYLRGGGDLDPVIDSAVLADFHPRAEEIREREWQESAQALRRDIVRQRARRSPPPASARYPRLDTATVLAALPSLSTLIGFEGSGAHPVHGSSTGHNLHVDGDVWYCFRPGHGGGGVFEWIAVQEGIIGCGERLEGKDFVRALEAAARISGLIP